LGPGIDLYVNPERLAELVQAEAECEARTVVNFMPTTFRMTSHSPYTGKIAMVKRAVEPPVSTQIAVEQKEVQVLQVLPSRESRPYAEGFERYVNEHMRDLFPVQCSDEDLVNHDKFVLTTNSRNKRVFQKILDSWSERLPTLTDVEGWARKVSCFTKVELCEDPDKDPRNITNPCPEAQVIGGAATATIAKLFSRAYRYRHRNGVKDRFFYFKATSYRDMLENDFDEKFNPEALGFWLDFSRFDARLRWEFARLAVRVIVYLLEPVLGLFDIHGTPSAALITHLHHFYYSRSRLVRCNFRGKTLYKYRICFSQGSGFNCTTAVNTIIDYLFTSWVMDCHAAQVKIIACLSDDCLGVFEEGFEPTHRMVESMTRFYAKIGAKVDPFEIGLLRDSEILSRHFMPMSVCLDGVWEDRWILVPQLARILGRMAFCCRESNSKLSLCENVAAKCASIRQSMAGVPCVGEIAAELCRIYPCDDKTFDAWTSERLYDGKFSVEQGCIIAANSDTYEQIFRLYGWSREELSSFTEFVCSRLRRIDPVWKSPPGIQEGRDFLPHTVCVGELPANPDEACPGSISTGLDNFVILAKYSYQAFLCLRNKLRA
jgi:hypothetical protein